MTLLRQDFDFHLPPGVPRRAPPRQLERRSVLARSRNRLLIGTPADEDRPLWLGVGYRCWGMPNLEIVHASE